VTIYHKFLFLNFHFYLQSEWDLHSTRSNLIYLSSFPCWIYSKTHFPEPQYQKLSLRSL